jgi:SAM-dependent methyltransferase
VSERPRGDIFLTAHSKPTLSERTIADFGDQWTAFQGNEGFYGSTELFLDVCGPLLDPEEIRGRRITDIGSGTGRIVQMLMGAGAAHVTAVEPSAAFEVLQRNVAQYGDRVTCVHATGDRLPAGDYDYVVSIGVLHHIPDPAPVVAAARRALRPGGRMVAWLYGREGNAAYLALAMPARALTVRLPRAVVLALARAANALMTPYIAMCRSLPLPLAGYFTEVFGRMSHDKRVLIIYDQLKPAYAKYYSRHEAIALLESQGLVNVRVHHRHGYSWTVIGTKPQTDENGRPGMGQ